jgi:hypothetical protein
VLYLMDRAQLDYHFSKLGEPGWKALADADPKARPDPTMIRAQRVFYGRYGLPEFRNPVTPLAAADFLAASRAGEVPDWVFAVARISDIRDAGRATNEA